MNSLPPAYVINLDRSTDRLARFRDRNRHLEIARAPGVDGAVIDRTALVAQGCIDPGLDYGAGAIGCALSHIRLWQSAAAEGRGVTVFEDDAIISHHFEPRANDVLEFIPPDWDIVHWGCHLNPLFLWVDAGSTKAQLQGYGGQRYHSPDALRLFQEERVVPAPLRLLHGFGAFGYSLSLGGARAALEHCLPLRKRFVVFNEAGVTLKDEGIDCTLCGLYPSIKAYLCLPLLVVADYAVTSDREAVNEGNQLSSAD